MTKFNGRLYLVDKIDFQLTPETYVFSWRQLVNEQTREFKMVKTNSIEYYQKKHGISINGDNQKCPMLVVTNFRKNERIYIPSCICNQASLPDYVLKDTYAMKALQEKKISDPQQRLLRI